MDVPESAAGSRLQEFFSARGTPQARLEAGQSLDLGGDVRLEVLACAEGGCALRLEYGSFTALLPGGNLPSATARQRPARPQPGPPRITRRAGGLARRRRDADARPRRYPARRLGARAHGWDPVWVEEGR